VAEFWNPTTVTTNPNSTKASIVASRGSARAATAAASYGHVERDTVLDTADRLRLETTLTPRRQR
jgi:hypothetical protein